MLVRNWLQAFLVSALQAARRRPVLGTGRFQGVLGYIGGNKCGVVRHRYKNPAIELFKHIHDREIGDLRAIYGTYYTGPVKPMPPATERKPTMTDLEWQLRNWYNFVWLCGDSLVEQAVHSVDKIAWAMKEFGLPQDLERAEHHRGAQRARHDPGHGGRTGPELEAVEAKQTAHPEHGDEPERKERSRVDSNICAVEAAQPHQGHDRGGNSNR